MNKKESNKYFRQIERELAKRDESIIEKLTPFFEGLYKFYFRCEVDGWENVPETKALYVGNHNGLLTFEVLMISYAWRKYFGGPRKALGLAHSVAMKNPFFKWLIPKMGAVPAHKEIAREAFKRDYSLLVYPGGEKEAFRPSYDRKKVDFFGRKGFIKLALDSEVPIVPVISCGAHETYLILDRGEEIAQKLGVTDRLRIHGMPLTFRSIFFAFCLVSGVFTFFPILIAPAAFLWMFIPLPAKMQFRFLEPIDVKSMWKSDLSEEDNLQSLYDHILGTMQKALESDYEARRFPVLG